jgi:hypothetical protein
MYNHVDVEDLRKWVDLLPALQLPEPVELPGVKSLDNTAK